MLKAVSLLTHPAIHIASFGDNLTCLSFQDSKLKLKTDFTLYLL